MRLMIGYENVPSLLVEVSPDYDPTNFTFDVINGGWSGRFMYGNIYVNYTQKWYHKRQILTDNQDRLRGGYNTVFNNFDNVDYVAPKPKKIDYSDLDDDIPF